MAGWSSLPPDLVRRVADRVLAENDVDYYMSMRAVCQNWRVPVLDSCWGGAVIDDLCRFRPSDWVMLDEEPKGGDGPRLFLNVCTGRFIRRPIPALRGHVLVAASDGLLVLANKNYSHAAGVLNPFTGSFIPFAAAIPRENRVRAVVAVA